MTFLQKHFVVFFLVVIVAIGFFLRAYNFSDWLHFELDQARDARVIDDALEGGPGELTLLGPKAGGTFLRLAPGFYYLQYVSGLIFGGTPSGIALIVMLLSVLTVPLFFLLVRRYFSEYISLGLTLLFAVSHFMVMYGRFAWNPNLIPFFTLLGLYSLLRAVDPEETKKNRWFLASVFSLVAATHFHFLAFLALPVIAGALLLIRRPKFSGKAWLGAVMITLVLYVPVMMNEWETQGLNAQEFVRAITKKSTKEDHSLIEKSIRNATEHALYGLVITTGYEGGRLPSFRIDFSPERTQDRAIVWVCDAKCDEGKWQGVIASLVLFAATVLLVAYWWRERERRKSDFLLLIGIWFAVTFFLFLPLSYGIAPRFFLVSGPVFIIFIGFLVQWLARIAGSREMRVMNVSLALLFFVGSNLYFLEYRFSELARAGTEAVDSAPDRILKELIRVTLEQQNAIVDFLEERSRENGYPVYMFSEPQHRRALKYLMEQRGIENAVLGFDGVYRQGVYYLILRTQSDLDDRLEKYRVSYEVGKMTPFGTLIAIELHPKPEAIIGERQDFSDKKSSPSKAPPRYTWKEFFERNQTESDSEQEENVFDESEDSAVVEEEEE